MAPEIGDLLLYISLILCLSLALTNFIVLIKNEGYFYSTLFLLNHQTKEDKNYDSNKLISKLSNLAIINKYCWLFILLSLCSSFILLIYCHVISDFSVLNVAMNSHTTKPLLYKIAGSWGSHEGSMLLWILALVIVSFLFILTVSNNNFFIHLISLRASAIQGLIISFFLSFITFTSNPFDRIFPTPIEGLGFNPVLQDIGLTIHPPILYLGYVGFSLPYAITVSFLFISNAIRKREYNNSSNSIDSAIDSLTYNWFILLKPWVVFAWSWLTLGIGLGSWWAYRELGWGGFWFWDPVENAALMPWLAGIALIHLLYKYNGNKGLFYYLSLILGLSSFILSLIGMFLVRSGIITSVHSFASDPKRGVWALAFLTTLIIVGLLALFKTTNIGQVDYYNNKKHKLKAFLITSNVTLMLLILFIVMLGTLYPLGLDLFTNRKISVGAPYFNNMINPLFLTAGCLCSLTLNKQFNTKSILSLRDYFTATLASLGILAVIDILNNVKHSNLDYLSHIGILIGLIIITTSFFHLGKLLWLRFLRVKTKVISYPVLITHIAFGLAMISLSVLNSYSFESQSLMKVGDKIKISNYDIQLAKINYYHGSNYITKKATFLLSKNYHNKQESNQSENNNINVIELNPEIRFYLAEKQITFEVGILSNFIHDIYLSIADGINEQELIVKAYYKPFINLLWLSVLLAFIGGISSFLKNIRIYILDK